MYCRKIHYRFLIVVAALLSNLAAAAPSPTTTVAPELPMRVEGAIRGVWIPTPDHTDFFTTRATIDTQLRELADVGISTVFVVMWNQGRTLYPSRVMKAFTGVEIDERMRGRDPLQEIIDAAKPLGIKVFAWFEFGFATDMNGGKGREIAEIKPQWVAMNAAGKPVIKNGFRWLNALDGEVQDFMLSLMMEVVEKYDVAGIQGDDRLPAMPSEGGYNPGTVALYEAAHEGRPPPSNAKDPAWVQWRADRLNHFMARIHGEAKRRKPTIVISMAPSVFPWSREEYLQDWPAWVRNGWVDNISPQLYRKDFNAYQATLRAITRAQVGETDIRRLTPGILLDAGKNYRASDQTITLMLEANRREGVAGEVFFFNEGVRARLPLLKKLYARSPQ